MKKTILVCLLASMFIGGSASAEVVENKLISYSFKTRFGDKSTIRFPFIIMKDKLVANKINTFLHQEILNTLPPDSLDGKVVEINSPEYVDISLSKLGLINDGRVLSITIYLEFCGAYCDNNDISYAFDVRNGRLLTKNEIIKNENFINISKIVAKSNANTIKNFLANLEKQSVKTENKDAHDVEEINNQISMYEHCLSMYDSNNESAAYGKDENIGSMTIVDRGLNFSHGRCSNNAMKGIDELWDVTHTIKNKDLKPYLTNYGKYIMLGEGVGEVPRINPYSQLYRGKIGAKIDVVMSLGNLNRYSQKNYDHSMFYEDKYFYTKYKKPILLNLSEEESKNGEYVLYEQSENDGNPVNKIKFKIVDSKLIGHWIGKDKVHSFEAEPY